jgi:hypothetical protein
MRNPCFVQSEIAHGRLPNSTMQSLEVAVNQTRMKTRKQISPGLLTTYEFETLLFVCRAHYISKKKILTVINGDKTLL